MNIVVYLKLEKDYQAYAEVDQSTCEGCGICAKICPFEVPSISIDETVEILPEKCRGCGACVPYCKTNSIRMQYTLNNGPYSSAESVPVGLRNPLDKNAIEAGLAVRDELGGKVWVLAEGSPRYEESIRESLVMGVDEGILLCDPKFMGSDHLASSFILEGALKKLGDCDLLIAPQRTSRGEPLFSLAWVAARLGMAYMPFVRSIEPGREKMLVRRKWGEKMLELSVSLPAALTVERGINEPRGLSLTAAARVMGKTVFHWSSEDLDLGGKRIGETGSEVRLSMVEALPKRRRKKRKGGEILKGSPEVLAGTLVERLKEWRIL